MLDLRLCDVGRGVVQLLSTKIVQISDTSMKLSQITKAPKGNIFWCRAKPN